MIVISQSTYLRRRSLLRYFYLFIYFTFWGNISTIFSKRCQLPHLSSFHIIFPSTPDVPSCVHILTHIDGLLRWPSPYLKKPRNQTSHDQESFFFFSVFHSCICYISCECTVALVQLTIKSAVVIEHGSPNWGCWPELFRHKIKIGLALCFQYVCEDFSFQWGQRNKNNTNKIMFILSYV